MFYSLLSPQIIIYRQFSRCVNQYPMLLQAHRLSTNVKGVYSSEEKNYEDTFKSSLPSIIDLVMNNQRFANVTQWRPLTHKLLEYSLTGINRKGCGNSVVKAYEAAEKPENITKESLKMARTLGWCAEIQIAHILILDDIQDRSVYRRGKPCWHTLPDVGLAAITDAMILNGVVFDILKDEFNMVPQYTTLIDLFNENMIYTFMGSHLEDDLRHRVKNNEQVSLDEYFTACKFKTAYCIFRLPTLLGYALANYTDKNILSKVEDICFDLGKICQIQNDIEDCYDVREVTGKEGNDIQEGKCTWLSVNALRLCSAAQRAEFVHNYAHSDPARVQAVKRLYEQLNLHELYQQDEKLICDNILAKANALPDNHKHLILNYMNRIFLKSLG